MFGIQDFSTFLVAGIALNLLPGADTIYIVGRSVAQGKKAGILSVLGISTGSVCHTLAASFGLSALLAASAGAFLVVKYIGAGYLIFLGIQMLRAAPSSPRCNNLNLGESPFGTIYRQGILTNILNPKVALFFLAFLPQFISPENPYGVLPFLILGTVFIFTGTCWCLFIAISTATLTERVKSRFLPKALLQRITGTLLVGLGLKLAYEKLP